MTIQELQERISKKEQDIAKKEKNLVKYVVSDEFTAMCDRYFKTGDRSELEAYKKSRNAWCLPEYYSKRRELEDAKATLAKYYKQLEVAKDKANTLSEMPAVLVEFKDYLIEKWDKYDEWKKATIKEEYKTQPRGIGQEYHKWQYEMRNRWGIGWYDFMYLTSEQIHNQNVKDAETLVLNLINRTIEITGKIIDCNALYLDQDNSGFTIINGVVIGEKGKARVESILAGGYNIQRLHVRVLVHPVK